MIRVFIFEENVAITRNSLRGKPNKFSLRFR
jgi:hypothetical protein